MCVCTYVCMYICHPHTEIFRMGLCDQSGSYLPAPHTLCQQGLLINPSYIQTNRNKNDYPKLSSYILKRYSIPLKIILEASNKHLSTAYQAQAITQ